MSVSLLGAYSGLDLTDEKGMFCGRLLADLGADVIKVEQPGGDTARNLGPFFGNVPSPERSIFWWAFNANKRGITLSLETAQGRDIFLKLLAKTAFLVESFPPGYLGKLGLAYEDLSKDYPDLVVVSITPFGQSGPYKNHKASDIVLQAMGGYMFHSGDADRAPVRISGTPQAYLHGGLHAAIGALLALWHRAQTGEGQHVDVSIQEAVVRTRIVEPLAWTYEGRLHPRAGQSIYHGSDPFRFIWSCKDGYIVMRLLGSRYARSFAPLVEWMVSEGMASFLPELNWNDLDLYGMTAEELQKMEQVFSRFFMRHTRAELWEQALRRRIMLAPVSTLSSILEDNHLSYRNFWKDAEAAEPGKTIRYPGFPYQFSLTPCQVKRRAPLIGEHNHEIYTELGIPTQEIRMLQRDGVI